MSDQSSGDNINLIDFLAVIIRYRLIIIGTLIISLFFSFIAVLFIPKKESEDLDKGFTQKAFVEIHLTPDVLSFVKEKVLFDYVYQIVTDPQILVQAFIESKSERYSDIFFNIGDEKSLRNSLHKFLDENPETYLVDRNLDGFSLYLKIEDSFDFNSFFDALLELTNLRMVQLIRPYAEGEVWKYENVLKKEHPTAIFDVKYQFIYNRYSSAVRFIKQNVSSVIIIQDPYSNSLILPQKDIRMKILNQAVIISILTLLISVIFVFFLHNISNIRNSSNSMEILRKAMQRKRR